jgi:hypothetical protein
MGGSSASRPSGAVQGSGADGATDSSKDSAKDSLGPKVTISGVDKANVNVSVNGEQMDQDKFSVEAAKPSAPSPSRSSISDSNGDSNGDSKGSAKVKSISITSGAQGVQVKSSGIDQDNINVIHNGRQIGKESFGLEDAKPSAPSPSSSSSSDSISSLSNSKSNQSSNTQSLSISNSSGKFEASSSGINADVKVNGENIKVEGGKKDE